MSRLILFVFLIVKIDALKSVRSSTSSLVTDINRLLGRLLVYNDLWKTNKDQHVRQFTGQVRSYDEYDDRMNYFCRIEQILNERAHVTHIYAIEFSLKQFYYSLTCHCREWIEHYGQQLYVRASQQLRDINERFDRLFNGLEHDADTLSDLMFVLDIIDEIHNEHDRFEHSINDIQQVYDILERSNCYLFRSDRSTIQCLPLRFEQLTVRSRLVQRRLKSIRTRFRDITQYDIDLFQSVVNEFIERFDRYGPQTLSNDLVRIVSIVEQYEHELDQLEQRKCHFNVIMKHFQMPWINYVELVRVRCCLVDFRRLIHVYDEFKRKEQCWSTILWTDVDMNRFMADVDEFIQYFRCLSIDMSTDALTRTIDTYLTGNQSNENKRRQCSMFVRCLSKKKRISFVIIDYEQSQTFGVTRSSLATNHQ
jgi:dynein heavy chain, axonemal